MIFNKLTILIFVILFNACNNNMITTNENINNKNENSIVDEFGTPKTEQIIQLYKGVNLYEYQSNLFKHYPNLEEKDTILIKEMLWELKNGEKMVIWLENQTTNDWQSFDNLKWSKKIKF